MRILNFSHPLTQLQLDDISACFDIPSADIQVEDISVQIENDEDLRPQLEFLVNQIHFRPDETDIYVNLPGLAIAAAVLVDVLQCRDMDIHLIRIVSQTTASGSVFQFKEIVDL